MNCIKVIGAKNVNLIFALVIMGFTLLLVLIFNSNWLNGLLTSYAIKSKLAKINRIRRFDWYHLPYYIYDWLPNWLYIKQFLILATFCTVIPYLRSATTKILIILLSSALTVIAGRLILDKTTATKEKVVWLTPKPRMRSHESLGQAIQGTLLRNPTLVLLFLLLINLILALFVYQTWVIKPSSKFFIKNNNRF